MRTIFISIYVIFLLGAPFYLQAQDQLVLRNGDIYVVKVLRSSEDEDKVKYIYPSETTVYQRPKSVISYILYEDGRKEVFDERVKNDETISSRPTTTPQTPVRAATTDRTQTPANNEASLQDIKTTFVEADVKDMTRLSRISATSSISYKDAVQQLKKQAAALGATTILVMDVPDNDNANDIEVIGVAYRDERAVIARQTMPTQSRQTATSSADERRRRTARLTEDYNNNTKLILDDPQPRQQTQRPATQRPATQQQAQRTPERPTTQQRAQTPSDRLPPPSDREIFAAEEEDAVYLLNGRVVKGTIEEFEPDDFVSIRTSTGRIYEYSMDEVRRVTLATTSRNARASGSTAASRRPSTNDGYANNRNQREQRPRKDNFYQGEQDVRGYKGIFDVGYTHSLGPAEKGRFELNTSHGLQMNKYLFVGLGLGLHMYSARKPIMRENMGTDNYPQYADSTVGISQGNGVTLYPTSYKHGIDSSFMFMPLFLDFRGYLPIENSTVSPFVSIKLGCSFNLSDGFRPAGFYFAPSVGAKFNVSPNIGLYLNLGYTFQGLGESGRTEHVTGTEGSTTTTIVQNEGYGYYYRNSIDDLRNATSVHGLSFRLGIEF